MYYIALYCVTWYCITVCSCWPWDRGKHKNLQRDPGVLQESGRRFERGQAVNRLGPERHSFRHSNATATRCCAGHLLLEKSTQQVSMSGHNVLMTMSGHNVLMAMSVHNATGHLLLMTFKHTYMDLPPFNFFLPAKLTYCQQNLDVLK